MDITSPSNPKLKYVVKLRSCSTREESGEMIVEGYRECRRALDKIKAIRERIVSGGADFAEEAKKNSDCPSGQEGGSLGWFGRGMMVPEFDKVAFEMKKGEGSGVVSTQFGYHIIYKADEKGGGEQTLVDVHDQIKDLLRHEARGRAMDSFVAELKANAKIEYRECCGRHLHGKGEDCHCGCHHG